MATELGDLLRSAREAKRLTQAKVGAHVGITYSAVGQYETGRIKTPRPENVIAIADLLEVDRKALNDAMVRSYGITVDGVLADTPSNSAGPGARRAPVRPEPLPREVELAPDAPDFGRLGDARDVPEYGIAVGGDSGDFTLNGEVVGHVTRPRSLRGRNVFAVRVKGTSMVPRFDEGDVLYVEEHREPAIGEDGVFEMKPGDEWEAGHAFVKNLVAKGMGIVRVRQWNPAEEFTYRRDQMKKLYRVVPRNELLSV